MYMEALRVWEPKAMTSRFQIEIKTNGEDRLTMATEQVNIYQDGSYEPNRLLILHNEYGPDITVFFNRKQLEKKYRALFDKLVKNGGWDFSLVSWRCRSNISQKDMESFEIYQLCEELSRLSSVKDGVSIRAKYVHVLSMVR